jgi:hypothetical protein
LNGNTHATTDAYVCCESKQAYGRNNQTNIAAMSQLGELRGVVMYVANAKSQGGAGVMCCDGCGTGVVKWEERKSEQRCDMSSKAPQCRDKEDLLNVHWANHPANHVREALVVDGAVLARSVAEASHNVSGLPQGIARAGWGRN